MNVDNRTFDVFVFDKTNNDFNGMRPLKLTSHIDNTIEHLKKEIETSLKFPVTKQTICFTKSKEPESGPIAKFKNVDEIFGGKIMLLYLTHKNDGFSRDFAEHKKYSFKQKLKLLAKNGKIFQTYPIFSRPVPLETK